MPGAKFYTEIVIDSNLQFPLIWEALEIDEVQNFERVLPKYCTTLSGYKLMDPVLGLTLQQPNDVKAILLNLAPK